MRLLFDHNLSPALVRRLGDLFPGSIHVWMIGLDSVPDEVLWEYARDHGFVLVSKDSDFEEISLARGSPPQWVWVRTGNATTAVVEALFRRHFATLETFFGDPAVRIYVLRSPNP